MQPLMRRDPAPSRLSYRLERLMLTPLFRLGLRVGLPFALAFGAGTWWFSQEPNRDAFLGLIADIRAEIESRPEFQVTLMAIDGASPGVADDIREILPLDFPVSSFDLDLDQMREMVMELDAVRTASLRVLPGGTLQLSVVERIPAVVWRHRDGLELLDESGALVGPAALRADHADLPLVAGEGADRAVPEALALLAAAQPITDRLRGLVRVGERRWDLVLDRDQRILLPEDSPVLALERVIAMDQAMDMLDRDLVSVDLRLPRRPTLRMSPTAVQELIRIKAQDVGETLQ